MKTLEEFFHEHVPRYKSRSISPFIDTFKWSNDDSIPLSISPSRCAKRLKSYIIPGELQRAAAIFKRSPSSGASIRFGLEKSGHGFYKERGDFCLIGGVLRRKHLTVFYRSIDLLGGLFYDLCLFGAVRDNVGPISRVTIMAASASVVARRGGSNEKLYKQLRDHYASR